MFLYLDVKYRYIFSIVSEQIVTDKYHANDEVTWIRLEEYVIILTWSLFWLYHLLRQELKSQISYIEEEITLPTMTRNTD